MSGVKGAEEDQHIHGELGRGDQESGRGSLGEEAGECNTHYPLSCTHREPPKYYRMCWILHMMMDGSSRQRNRPRET